MSADAQERLAREEYIQESNDWRHRDVLTWQLPSILVGVGGSWLPRPLTFKTTRPNGFGALSWALLQVWLFA